ncbi:MAG: DMT family transporter [Candidatus Bathyarchaeota archaeon]|nr:MAG: DMT family transporter [Candidatus Bathyarchaeota archaeon]
MNNISRHAKLLSELGLLYSAALWGATFFIVKDVLREVDPIVLVGYRFILAATLLGGVCLVAKKPLLKNIRHGLLTGFILWLLYVSQTAGLNITTASNSGFITGLFVAFVPIYSFALTKRRPTLMEIIATIVSLFGLWMLTGGLKDINIGDLLTIIAAATYALHILILDKYMNEGDDPYLLSFQQFLFVGTISLLIGVISGLNFSLVETQTMGVIFFLAFFPTLSAFVIQVVAQKITKPLQVSLILALEPVFAGLFAWTLGNEPIIIHRAIGGLFIVIGMISSGIPQRHNSQARE